MPKKIVFFSDGTGNSSAKAEKTNVWRLFLMLDQTRVDQIAKYDDGVGTSHNKYLAAIGGAFGWGLKRNVLDLYTFVCRNYDSGDEIYGFGFSRGAFTIRLLVDFIATEGLITFRSEEGLSRNAAAAYRHYRSAKFPSKSPLVILMRWLRDAVLWIKDRVKGYRTYEEVAESTAAAGRAEITIRFLGLWDTVEAYGMPIAGLKRGIDLVIWPMMFGDLSISPRVHRACHALSLDDQRTTFHPLLWDEVAEADMVAKRQVAPGRITQVWFAGVHSNVGGGYPEDQLSLVSLDWMMNEAIESGLLLDELAVAQVLAAKSPYARLYDSRAGIASYYGYSPRQIYVSKDREGNLILPIIHGSVVMRMAHGSDHYAPISLPHEFWVLAPDGDLLAMEGVARSLKLDTTKKPIADARPATKAAETNTPEKARLVEAIKQLARPDRHTVILVWDTVFWRRFNYFVTLALTALLIAYPLVGDLITKFEHWYLTIRSIGPPSAIRETGLMQINIGARGPITSIVDSLSGFIPSYASPWITALKQYPLEFSLIAVSILLMLLGSNILEARIHDRAWFGWHKTFRSEYLKWCKEAKNGWRIGVLLTLDIAVLCLVLAELCRWSDPVQRELGYLVALLLTWLVVRELFEQPVLRSDLTALEGTLGHLVARFLRNNRFLQGTYKWVFDGAVPIVFALLLVAAGLVVANRGLFDVVSASGYFCEGTRAGEARNVKNAELSTTDFKTDRVCWRSGLVLEAGQRYRITLITEGDWFDQIFRADVAGFSGETLWHVAATPLRRWWSEKWFRPIVRIGTIGNDEYVLKPADDFVEHDYHSTCPGSGRVADGGGIRAKVSKDIAQGIMACAPTPDDRKEVVTEIKARTTGELFIFVNDAVLMLPKLTDVFYSNNSGAGRIVVKRMPPNASM
jgi:uncharacterized protein (DUF2235 family)